MQQIKPPTDTILQPVLAQLEKLQGEVHVLRTLVTHLTNLVAEHVVDPDKLQNIVTGAWIEAKPNKDLTWSVDMNGKNFLDLMLKTTLDGTLGDVIEVGPGYGRVLSTLLEREQQTGQRMFKSYLGIDLSQENVDYLAATFGSDRIAFVQGDFHTVKLQGQYDTVYASAVFMHLFPDLTEAARRAHKLLRDTGRLCFDVPPGDFSYIDPGFKLFVKHYSKPYLHGYIATAGFTYCTVEREADFAPDSEGWFVSASKQPLPACAPA